MGFRPHFVFVAASIFGAVFSTNAAVVERALSVHIDDTLIHSGTDNAGNAGDFFRFDIYHAPFFIQAGDTIVTHIDFDNLLVVTDTGNGFFGFGGNFANGLEVMNFTYWYGPQPLSNGSGVMSYTMTLDVVSGEPTMATASGAVNSGGGGMTAAIFYNNFTDSTIVLDGMDITTHANSYAVSSGTGQFDHFSGSIYAGDVSVRAAPEPATLALLALGLAGLGFSHRKQ